MRRAYSYEKLDFCNWEDEELDYYERYFMEIGAREGVIAARIEDTHKKLGTAEGST